MFRSLVFAAVALVPACSVAHQPALPAVVVVHAGQPVPDVRPGQRLDITGMTAADCDQAGGVMVAGTCQGVDF